MSVYVRVYETTYKLAFHWYTFIYHVAKFDTSNNLYHKDEIIILNMKVGKSANIVLNTITNNYHSD